MNTKISLALVQIVLIVAAIGCGSSRPYKPIEGLKVDAIKQSMTNHLHMVFEQPQKIKSWYHILGKSKDPISGAEFTCDIAYYEDGSVWSVGYSVDWAYPCEQNVGNVRTLQIRELSKAYFQHCMSIPYSGSDAGKAIDFVNSALKTAGAQSSIILGSAKIEVANCSNNRFVQVDISSANANRN